MAGTDFYCSVSGARYFASANEVSKEVSHGKKIGLGLDYSDEDVESSRAFVLFCPCEILQDGTMIKYTDFEDPRPTKYTESTITEVFDVYTGEYPAFGDYRDINGQMILVLPGGNTLIVTYTSYLILKQAAPEVKPHILYALAYGANCDTMGEVAGIDYGPVGRIFGQDAYWAAICGDSEGRFEDPHEFWQQLLNGKERTEEDILHDAWKGPGNMWVFVRPDCFPITETLEANPIPNFPYPIHTDPTLQNSRLTFTSLPPDILLSTCEFLPIRSTYALLTTCKKLCSTILPHANPIARRRLIDDEPWYLPAGPFALNSTTTKNLRQEMHGREEIEWWVNQWGAGGIRQEDMDTKIPWFMYRKECSKSTSMWNRKRIWGIAKQLDALARVKGLL